MPISFHLEMACVPDTPAIGRQLTDRNGFVRRVEGFSGEGLHFYQPALELWVDLFDSDPVGSVELRATRGFVSRYVVSFTLPKREPMRCLPVIYDIVASLFNAVACDLQFTQDDQLVLRRLDGLTWFNPAWEDEWDGMAQLKRLANSSADPLIQLTSGGVR